MLKGCLMFKFTNELPKSLITFLIKTRCNDLLQCKKGLFWKKPIRHKFINIGLDQDDFVKNMKTCIITCDVFRVLRIFNTVNRRYNKRFVNKMRRKNNHF